MSEENPIQQAKDVAYNFLSYRERSQFEIKQKLQQKGYDLSVIKKVISDLKELNYINDYRFATKWVTDRIKFKPRGRYKLEYELKKKGIDNKTIQKVLTKMVTDEIESKLAKKLSRKWLKKNSNKDKHILKLKRYLYNKGISRHIINNVVNSHK